MIVFCLTIFFVLSLGVVHFIVNISLQVKMQLHEFLAITHDIEKLIDFLIENNLINNEIYCQKCNNKLQINKSNLLFRCRNVFYEKNVHKKYVKIQCDFKVTAKLDTWFSKSKLNLETICRLTAYFIMLRPPRQDFLRAY